MLVGVIFDIEYEHPKEEYICKEGTLDEENDLIPVRLNSGHVDE